MIQHKLEMFHFPAGNSRTLYNDEMTHFSIGRNIPISTLPRYTHLLTFSIVILFWRVESFIEQEKEDAEDCQLLSLYQLHWFSYRQQQQTLSAPVPLSLTGQLERALGLLNASRSAVMRINASHFQIWWVKLLVSPWAWNCSDITVHELDPISIYLYWGCPYVQ